MDLLGLYPRDEFRKKMTERNDPLAMRIKAQIDTEVSLLRGTIGNAQWLDGLDDEQWRMLADEIMPIYERRCAGRVDWQRLAMLLLCGYVRTGTGGLEWDDYLTELVSLSERETALIENAFRDWKWLEHGQLIEYEQDNPS